MEKAPLDFKIKSVSDLLLTENLIIPKYQRPYTWEMRHVSPFLQDIQQQSEKQQYRFGTVVFHEECCKKNSKYSVVDGQQRLITLFLILHAIYKNRTKKTKKKKLLDNLTDVHKAFKKFNNANRFASRLSQENIQKNFVQIQRVVASDAFTEQHIEFLLNRCEVVTFTLFDISEAFQFFDAQNTRGKELDPHNLLKAFHLREFSLPEHHKKGLQAKKEEIVACWEQAHDKTLVKLFDKYLYRIRQWLSKNSARHFTKDTIYVFKGVNLDSETNYPYLEPLKHLSQHMDDLEFSDKKDIKKPTPFPFCLDQPIINGRRFFEMVTHYLALMEQVTNKSFLLSMAQLSLEANIAKKNKTSKSSKATKNHTQTKTCKSAQILEQLSNYPNINRTGDKYIRSMFNCALMYYIDKFGYEQLDTAIEHIFVWAYQLRIRQYAVQVASIDNHVLNNNIFRVIQKATTPNDLFAKQEALFEMNTKTALVDKKDPLVILFNKIGYDV